jgi:methionine sulfoxide reductase heme-binding subunit
MSKWILAGGVAGVTIVFLLTASAARLGIVVVDLQRPDTHWFWYFSRAAGLSAYLALTLSVVLGLLLSTNVADKWIARGRSVELHKWISAVALALIVAHALVLVGDPYVRFDLVDLLVPFAAEYRRLAVALGVVSAYCTVIVFGSFLLRRLLGQRTWRAVHILAFPTFGLVTLHGMLAGSDSGTLWMRLVYLLSTTIVLWLVTYRLVARSSARLLVGAATGASAS